MTSPVSVSIAANDDDVLQIGSLFFPNFVMAGMAFEEEYEAGLRFLSVDVPPGATITSATITLDVTSIAGTPETTVYGVDVDDAAAWADPGNLPGNASTTTASASGPTATGSQQVTVTNIVQEIVDRGGWASGNDMAFVALNDKAISSLEHTWRAEDYSDAGGNQASLYIEYIGPPTGAVALSRRYSTTAGSAGDSESGTASGSLGKYMATTAPANAQIGNLFPNISAQQNATGITLYRCVFVHNGGPGTWFNAEAYIESQTAGGGNISIGADPTGVVPDDDTDPQAVEIANGETAPAGVTFSTPTIMGGGVPLGDILPDHCVALWVRMDVPPNAPALAADRAVVRFVGQVEP